MPWQAESSDASKDEPTALIIGMPVASMRPGTMRNPSPIPKNPDAQPGAMATIALIRHMRRSTGRTLVACGLRGRSMSVPTTSMATLNRKSSHIASIALPRLEPAKAPIAKRKDNGAAPPDIAFHRIADEVGKGID